MASQLVLLFELLMHHKLFIFPHNAQGVDVIVFILVLFLTATSMFYATDTLTELGIMRHTL